MGVTFFLSIKRLTQYLSSWLSRLYYWHASVLWPMGNNMAWALRSEDMELATRSSSLQLQAPVADRRLTHPFLCPLQAAPLGLQSMWTTPSTFAGDKTLINARTATRPILGLGLRTLSSHAL